MNNSINPLETPLSILICLYVRLIVVIIIVKVV